MKKIILFLLMSVVMGLSASAYSFMVDGLCYNKNSNGTSVTVTYERSSSPRYSNLSGQIVIPENVTYNGITYSVTSIGNYAFEGCSNLTSVTIGESVTSIGGIAFSGCTGLTSVTIGESVTSIGNSAFSGCSNLTDSLTIPNMVISIGSSAFSGCTGLTSVTIGESVTSIGNSAFSGCSGLMSVIWNATSCADFSSSSSPFNAAKASINSFTFGDHVEKIPAYLCYQLAGLTSLSIPNAVKSIGSSTFSGCSGLMSVIWNATSCADFSSSSPFNTAKASINSFTFGDHVEKIPAYLCYQLAGLTSLSTPNAVTSIGSYAFSGCTNLTSVTIGESVTSIGSYAFSSCSGLSSVTIGESVTSIGNSAFRGCSGLMSVIWNATSCADFSSSSPFNTAKASINSFTFGDHVEKIPAYLCYQLAGLTSLSTPNAVTSIGSYAFSACNGLTSVTIGESVTSIGNYAFSGCKGLTSVTIGESVTSIGSSAFRGCSNLTGSLTIPNMVISIGSSAFSGCTGLTSVTIGESVTSINSYAFSGCSGLISVTWNATSCADFSSSSSPFNAAKASINSFTFGDHVEKIPAYLCYQLAGLTSLSIPNSVTSIGDYAFLKCSSLTEVSIGLGLTNMNNNSFLDASAIKILQFNAIMCNNFTSSPFASAKLTSLIFGPNVKRIPAFLASKQTALTSVEISDSIEEIGKNAFSGCIGITSLSIPESVLLIDNTAFSGCTGISLLEFNIPKMSLTLDATNLTKIQIGDKVESITSVFSGHLDSLLIPSNVVNIGKGVFYNCKINNLRIEDCDTLLTNEIAYSYTGSSNNPYYGWYDHKKYNTFHSSNVKKVYLGRAVSQNLFGGVSGSMSSTGPVYCHSVKEISYTANQNVLEYYCDSIQTIYFGEKITDFPSTGFSTKVLTDVYAYWIDPPQIVKSFFTNEAYAKGTLHVPHGTANTYKSREGWKYFMIVDDLDSNLSKAESIDLSPSKSIIAIGDTLQIQVVIEPDNVYTKDVLWHSSNENVAVVTTEGVITAVGLGEVFITATTTDGSNLSDTCHVTVRVPFELSAQSVAVPVNTSRNIPVIIDNHVNVKSFAFTLTVPEGIDYIGDAIAAPRCSDFSISTTYNADSTVMRIEGQMTNQAMSAGKAPFVMLPFKSSKYIDTFILSLSDIEFVSTNDGVGTQNLEDITVTMRVLDLGDVNGDKAVDIGDVNALINYITGGETDLSNFGVGDMNNDGTIDVADINLIINLMLGLWNE